MRDYGKVSPQFWIGETGRELRGAPDAQVIAVYLVTGPFAGALGFYFLPTAIIADHLGMSREEVLAGLGKLEALSFAVYDHDREWVWVPEMARFQIGESLKPNDKRIPWIEKELRKSEHGGFALMFFERYAVAFNLRPIEGPSVTKRRPTVTPSMRFAILQRDGYACTYCGRGAPDVQLEVDHVVAVNDGGSNARENLTTACRECNGGKGDRRAIPRPSEAKSIEQDVTDTESSRPTHDLSASDAAERITAGARVAPDVPKVMACCAGLAVESLSAETLNDARRRFPRCPETLIDYVARWFRQRGGEPDMLDLARTLDGLRALHHRDEVAAHYARLTDPAIPAAQHRYHTFNTLRTNFATYGPTFDPSPRGGTDGRPKSAAARSEDRAKWDGESRRGPVRADRLSGGGGADQDESGGAHVVAAGER